MAAARYGTHHHICCACSQVMCVLSPDLGFQAAQRVVSSPPDVALSVLRDIVQSLPTVAKCVSVSCHDWVVSLPLACSLVACLLLFLQIPLTYSCD